VILQIAGLTPINVGKKPREIALRSAASHGVAREAAFVKREASFVKREAEKRDTLGFPQSGVPSRDTSDVRGATSDERRYEMPGRPCTYGGSGQGRS